MERILVFFHVLGVVIFLGNIVITFFWKLMANLSNDQKVLAFSQKMVSKTDRLFTVVGAGLIASTGYVYAAKIQLSVVEPWLLWAQVCFYASAVLWAAILVPIQHKQSKLAVQFEDGSPIPEQYWVLARYWNLIGALATLLPVVSLFLMITKPSF
jgi:uncharacterized membrane protein